jgi:hypothetical protein
MQHGNYIAEFERFLFKHGYAISNASLSLLIGQVDFAKLRDAMEQDRFGFYDELVKSINKHPTWQRGTEDGIEILGEHDATNIVSSMSEKAQKKSFASSRIRDIWCKIYIGGCP